MPTLHAALLPAVRAAERADYPVIRAILRAAYRSFEAEIGPGLFEVYLADLLDLDAHASHGELLVSPAAGEVVGYASFYPDTSVQGLGWPPGWAGGRGMAVHPAHRGRGVASALLDEMIRRARSSGAPVFAFHTAELMTSAVALYDRLGYRRAPEFDVDISAHYGIGGATPWRAIAYLRCLTDLAAPCLPDDLTGLRAA